jgi:hypothetical protein
MQEYKMLQCFWRIQLYVLLTEMCKWKISDRRKEIGRKPEEQNK